MIALPRSWSLTLNPSSYWLVLPFASPTYQFLSFSPTRISSFCQSRVAGLAESAASSPVSPALFVALKMPDLPGTGYPLRLWGKPRRHYDLLLYSGRQMEHSDRRSRTKFARAFLATVPIMSVMSGSL